LPYVVSSAILNAAHVHAVTAKGRRYCYGRRTRQPLTEDEVSERLERTKIEQKLQNRCKTAKLFQTYQIGFFNDFKWLLD
jgi:hypothetical protein